MAILLQGCKKGNDAGTAALVTVQAEHPEVGAISEYITADATLSPVAAAAISPKITAPVRTFYVQRGSKVKKGQLLAVLENRDLDAQALDNQGQYTAAQASFEMQTKAQVQEDYHKAELDVAQAKAQLELQQQIVDARQKLFAEGAIAGRDYDTAAAALVQAQAAYDVARNHLDSLKAVSRAGLAPTGAGTTLLRQREISGRRGAGLVLGNSQSDYRSCNRPSSVCRRNCQLGHAADHRDGHIFAFRESSSGANGRPATQGWRRGLGPDSRCKAASASEGFRWSVRRSIPAARRWKCGSA